jgi:hypothetical protein
MLSPLQFAKLIVHCAFSTKKSLPGTAFQKLLSNAQCTMSFANWSGERMPIARAVRQWPYPDSVFY